MHIFHGGKRRVHERSIVGGYNTGRVIQRLLTDVAVFHVTMNNRIPVIAASSVATDVAQL